MTFYLMFTLFFFVHFFNFYVVKMLGALAEDSTLALSTLVRLFKTSCNSSSRTSVGISHPHVYIIRSNKKLKEANYVFHNLSAPPPMFVIFCCQKSWDSLLVWIQSDVFISLCSKFSEPPPHFFKSFIVILLLESSVTVLFLVCLLSWCWVKLIFFYLKMLKLWWQRH